MSGRAFYPKFFEFLFLSTLRMKLNSVFLSLYFVSWWWVDIFDARGRPHVILDLAPYNLWRSKDREMKINEKTVIYGSRVILVPYEKEHVEKYHGWMQSEEILQATASEPLTIENEYKMQESWREDEDKLTFIILLASDVEDGHPEIDSMIGK